MDQLSRLKYSKQVPFSAARLAYTNPKPSKLRQKEANMVVQASNPNIGSQRQQGQSGLQDQP